MNNSYIIRYDDDIDIYAALMNKHYRLKLVLNKDIIKSTIWNFLYTYCIFYLKDNYKQESSQIYYGYISSYYFNEKNLSFVEHEQTSA